MASTCGLLPNILRRHSRRSIQNLSFLSSHPFAFIRSSQSAHPTDLTPVPTPRLNAASCFPPFCCRSFTSHSSSSGPGSGEDDLVTESEFFYPDCGGSEAVGEMVVNSQDCFLLVSAVISGLDSYHDFTGFPWWIVVASSTLALRITLLPFLFLQLNKLKKIAELFPKLPPPLPPPLSGRSYIDHILFFRRERRAVGCPSYLWFLASYTIQAPCFILWMTSIRRMSLDYHPGFDSGGILWFQNLTELPHGLSSPIFPVLIAGLHYINVKISFETTPAHKVSDLFGLLAKLYRYYLHFLSIPIFLIGFCIPQGSLVYWVTNSSLTIIQQLVLKHPAVRKKLKLPNRETSLATTKPIELETSEINPLGKSPDRGRITTQNLGPQELLHLSIQLLSKGQIDRALPYLRLALQKDPEYIRALLVTGQALLQKGQLSEAIEYLERAISKLFLVGHTTEAEHKDLLIVASQWAGAAYARQNKMAKALVHLERIACLEEPEDAKGKAHYFDGLLLLSSALYKEGRKGEALNYLRKAAAHDPAYNAYVEQCENEEDDLVNDLVNSRRRDY